jgi:hypothetical protein
MTIQEDDILQRMLASMEALRTDQLKLTEQVITKYM